MILLDTDILSLFHTGNETVVDRVDILPSENNIHLSEMRQNK